MSQESFIVGSFRDPTLVHGVHGGRGDLYWKRLVTGGHLHGDWESFEYVRLEAGGSVGKHRHSRTEEVYIVVSGQGVLEVAGQEVVMNPGNSVVTPLNGVHAFWNSGSAPVEFLVIETVPPEIAGLLPAYSPTFDEGQS
jgi:mannose-6-phosphate isomerase-like protein (cupin superfamily)